MIIAHRHGPSFPAGLNIGTSATAANGYAEVDRISLSVDNATSPYLTVNPKFDCLNLRPTGLGDLNTNFGVYKVVAHQPFRCTGQIKASYLQLGTSTDTSRLISALDSSQSTGSSRYITFGYDSSSLNQAEISFYLAGSGSSFWFFTEEL